MARRSSPRPARAARRGRDRGLHRAGLRRTQMADVADGARRREGHALPLRREQGGALRPRRPLRRRAASVRDAADAAGPHAEAGRDARVRPRAAGARSRRRRRSRRRSRGSASPTCAPSSRRSSASSTTRSPATGTASSSLDRSARDYPELAALWFEGGARRARRGCSRSTSTTGSRRRRAPPRPRRRRRRAARHRDARLLGRPPPLGPAPAGRGRGRGARRPSCASSSSALVQGVNAMEQRDDRRPDIDWLRVFATYLLVRLPRRQGLRPGALLPHPQRRPVLRDARALRLHRPLAHAALLPARRLVGRRVARARGAPAVRRGARARSSPCRLLAGCVLLGPADQVPRAAERARPEPHAACGSRPRSRRAFARDPERPRRWRRPSTRASSSSCPTFFTRLDRFTWAHLWFVAYLFTFTLLYLPLFLRLRREIASAIHRAGWSTRRL